MCPFLVIKDAHQDAESTGLKSNHANHVVVHHIREPKWWIHGYAALGRNKLGCLDTFSANDSGLLNEPLEHGLQLSLVMERLGIIASTNEVSSHKDKRDGCPASLLLGVGKNLATFGVQIDIDDVRGDSDAIDEKILDCEKKWKEQNAKIQNENTAFCGPFRTLDPHEISYHHDRRDKSTWR